MVNQQQTTLEQLKALIEPVCVDAGYELVEIEYKLGGPLGAMLRVFIDYPHPSDIEDRAPGEKAPAVVDSAEQEAPKSITCADCSALSHELSALLDVEDPIVSKYNLEVSSPGIERPLRKSKHFRRFIGGEVKLSLSHGVAGRRKFKGLLTSVSECGSTVTLEVDGTSYELPLADLAAARLIPDWGALMKGRGKR